LRFVSALRGGNPVVISAGKNLPVQCPNVRCQREKNPEASNQYAQWIASGFLPSNRRGKQAVRADRPHLATKFVTAPFHFPFGKELKPD
jgi:hypothetical protein